MQLKKIISILNGSKNVKILDKGNEILTQWITDGRAAYPLSKLPELDADTFFAIASVSEKDKGKWKVTREYVPASMNFEDNDDTENRIEKIGILINGLLPLATQKGCVLIEPEYLAPLKDEGDYELYERISSGGNLYIAVKTGLLLRAIILPVERINEEFVEKIENILRLSRIALQNNQKED